MGGRWKVEVMDKGVGWVQAPNSRHPGVLSCHPKEGGQMRQPPWTRKGRTFATDGGEGTLEPELRPLRGSKVKTLASCLTLRSLTTIGLRATHPWRLS